jgi:uncharacterized low-complexity protein
VALARSAAVALVVATSGAASAAVTTKAENMFRISYTSADWYSQGEGQCGSAEENPQ